MVKWAKNLWKIKEVIKSLQNINNKPLNIKAEQAIGLIKEYYVWKEAERQRGKRGDDRSKRGKYRDFKGDDKRSQECTNWNPEQLSSCTRQGWLQVYEEDQKHLLRRKVARESLQKPNLRDNLEAMVK